MSLFMLAAFVSLAANPDTVVVCPPVLQASLQPWLEHRRSEGHVIEVVAPKQTPDAIRQQIRTIAKSGKLRFVVLVGDAAESDAAAESSPRSPTVPTYFAKAEVGVRFGSEPLIATDNWYADLDDDDVPDLAIGRLTADSPQDLTRIVNKILTYERSANFGPWRSKINLWLASGVSAWWQTQSWRLRRSRSLWAEFRRRMQPA